MTHVPFYSPELDRTNDHPSELARDMAVELLHDGQLIQEVVAGNVTLALIRPQVGPAANRLGLPDAEAAEAIEGMITGLGVMAKFAFTFTPQAVQEFYKGSPEANMSVQPSRRPDIYRNFWEEFTAYMSSGHTTALLLYSPDGDAIPRWRAHLGHWNIDAVRDMSTIRGQLGVSKENNLVHGSDAPESVLRELEIIANCLDSEPTPTDQSL